jgi:hypothetical protein
MDKFTSDAMTAVVAAPVSPGIRGGPLLASGSRNATALRWDLYGDGAVGGPANRDIDAGGLTQPPPDAALSDSGRRWRANFSSMPPGRARSYCVIRQFIGANVSDAGMPA